MAEDKVIRKITRTAKNSMVVTYKAVDEYGTAADRGSEVTISGPGFPAPLTISLSDLKQAAELVNLKSVDFVCEDHGVVPRTADYRCSECENPSPSPVDDF